MSFKSSHFPALRLLFHRSGDFIQFIFGLLMYLKICLSSNSLKWTHMLKSFVLTLGFKLSGSAVNKHLDTVHAALSGV